MLSHRRFSSFCQCAITLALLSSAPAIFADEPVSSGPALYKDTSLPFEKRVADLISHMNLREKAEEIQVEVPPNDRLGIPAIGWWTEAIHGVGRAGTATVFPEAIAMAAAWDPDLMHSIGDAISDEARAKFDPNGSRYRGIMLWCPTINMARDPRWGRIEETYGEDPTLTSRLAVPFIKGLQGDDPKYLKTVATPKHFAMHSEEMGRMSSSYNISEKTLREYYLPAFYASFTEGHAASVMAAHNGINGIPDHANHWLLTDLLRDEWGFQGAVVSDWGGVMHLRDSHHIADTMEETVADALNAGLDVICDPHSPVMIDAIMTAVHTNRLSEKTLDQALSRSLLLRFRLGMFDPPEMVPYTHIPPTVIDSPEHSALALRTEQEGIVLLKNGAAPKGFGYDKLLPLDPARLNSVAVIGPYANQLHFGNYSGNPKRALNAIEAIKAALPDRVDVRTVDWVNVDGTVKAAETSDIAIVVLGLSNQQEMEGTDRTTLDIPPDQRVILDRIVQAQPLTICVLEGGSPIAGQWMDKVPAILMIWYPGEQGRVALADILMGKVNPSGKLPLTFYNSVNDLPPMSTYEISQGRTYMYLKKKPTFPFGFGLSYSKFDFAKLQLATAAGPAAGPLAANATLSVSLDVTNAGPMDGDEVVQLYVHQLDAPEPQPIKVLRAFKRATIPNGKTVGVKIDLPLANLATWNTTKRAFITEPGTYEIQVGSSSEDIRLKGTIQVK